MTSNSPSILQNPASFAHRFGKAVPLVLTILVWLSAATFETAYVAVLSSGIQQSDQARGVA